MTWLGLGVCCYCVCYARYVGVLDLERIRSLVLLVLMCKMTPWHTSPYRAIILIVERHKCINRPTINYCLSCALHGPRFTYLLYLLFPVCFSPASCLFLNNILTLIDLLRCIHYSLFWPLRWNELLAQDVSQAFLSGFHKRLTKQYLQSLQPKRQLF